MEIFDAEDVVVVVPRGRRVFVDVPEDDDIKEDELFDEDSELE